MISNKVVFPDYLFIKDIVTTSCSQTDTLKQKQPQNDSDINLIFIDEIHGQLQAFQQALF